MSKIQKYVWLILFLSVVLPAHAGKPKPKPKAKPKPSVATNKPVAKAPQDRVAQVKSGKLAGYYDKNNLAAEPVLSAPGIALLDADTGQFLYEVNSDKPMFPASTTKIMTGLLLAENTKPNDIVTCLDPEVTKVEPSSLHVKPWEKFKADQLLTGFLLRSGNDAAVVVAQHVGKSVAGFAEMMNQRAQEMGATNTHFTNPHGLHDPNHYTTAHDLGLIAYTAMHNTRFAAAVKTPRRKIERSINVKDAVVSSKAREKFYLKCQGADGIKTGYTVPAKHCFVGSATRNGRRLIGVVMGCPQNASADTLALLNWGFARFGVKKAITKFAPSEPIPVSGGMDSQVKTLAGGELSYSYDTLGTEPTVALEARPVAGLTAPIVKGQKVGTLLLKVDGRNAREVPLFATNAVERSQLAAFTPKGSSGNPLLVGGIGAGVLGVVGLGVFLGTSSKSARRRRYRQSPKGRRNDPRAPR
jgi:serine-type D-Ala-D-Ala carboxypeptidase (penicillin-binding protein 5/6)